jgi:secreted PhoX family phosphatase
LGVHGARAGTPARAAGYGAPGRAADQDGNVVLALPEGFQYVTFSRVGEPYGRGLVVPRNPDGMGTYRGPGRTVRLVRNHEVANAAGDGRLGIVAPPEFHYDPKAAGGCMTLDFDPRKKRLVRQFVSLGGTLANCAGGWSYRNSGWISCEEYTSGPREGYERPHGYAFYVPALTGSAVPALPIKAMGRFRHEAAVADAHGIVYETEDAGDTSGFYRYTPVHPYDLPRGTLQMLGIRGDAGATLHAGIRVGERLPVQWVNVDDPDPDLEHGAPRCFEQARARGGAAFRRLEGIFRGQDGRSIFFVSTTGGTARGRDGAGLGRIWQYTPADGKTSKEDVLTLVFESPSGSVLESADNLCITPRGAMLLCEDDGIDDGDRDAAAGAIRNVNRLIGLGPGGEPFTFAVNVLNNTEFAGACFSPDGDILFVNVYGDGSPGSGMTCAIWGPWHRGPL